MAEEKLKLQIVSPERVLYDDDVEMVTFHTTEGEMAVLYNHTPLTTTLTSGRAVVLRHQEGHDHFAVLHGGFVEVTEDSVTLLTDAAEWAREIDLDRAKAAYERAEERIAKEDKTEEIELEKQRAALRRAQVRIEVAQLYHSMKK